MRLTLTLLLTVLAQLFLSAETNEQIQMPACTSITVRDSLGDTEGFYVCEGNITFTANVAGIVPTDKPTFNWTISTGKIVSGQGTATITVDLSGNFGLEAKAEVEISGVSGLDAQCAKYASRKVRVGECFCPTVEISCPTGMREPGESVTISVGLSGARGNLKPTYNWQVSAGKITSGQGTPSITVDTTEMAGQNVTATVEVGGLPPECEKLRSCTLIPIESIPLARKYIEYGDVDRDSEEMRLAGFAIQLANEPASEGYIYIYGPSRVSKHLTRIRRFLVEKRGIDPGRLMLINGGHQEKTRVELWVAPPGATPPKPNSNF